MAHMLEAIDDRIAINKAPQVGIEAAVLLDRPQGRLRVTDG